LNTYLRLLCVCGILALCGRALPAQDTTVVNGIPAVTGQPYSAVEETETVQTLADGTHIDRRTTTKVWRDSQGRTRSEHYVKPLHSNGDAEILATVMIRDPIAGFEYLLNPREHSGEQSPLRPMVAGGPGGAPTARRLDVRAGNGGGAAAISPVAAQSPDPNFKIEQLGTQTMEGLVVDGTRTTRTIPAGTEGNDAPIQIVTERWVSKELRIPVLVKVSDPRGGDRTTQLTNINLTEPNLSLFQPPTDYTITTHE